MPEINLPALLDESLLSTEQEERTLSANLGVKVLAVEEDVFLGLGSNVSAPQTSVPLIEEVQGDVQQSELPSINTLGKLEAAFVKSSLSVGPTKIVGTDDDDYLVGTNQRDRIFALDGDDIVFALGSDDLVFGGNGADFLDGGSGNDRLNGGPGNDIFEGDFGNDILQGEAGNDLIYGRLGNDRLFGGEGIDELLGGDGNDLFNAGAGDDLADGEAGNDTVYGDSGYDDLNGGDGDDQVIGGADNDFLFGGSGNDRLIGVDPYISELGFGVGEIDTLTGDGGSDTFALGADTQVYYVGGGDSDYAHITDFNLSEDVVELAANPGAVNVPISVTEIGEAGQLLPDAQVIPGGSATLDSITGTISSNNDVDLFQITLTGDQTFSATTVGGAGFDTELFLFDANGIGVYGNDDVSSDIDQSTLPAGTPLTPQQPGTYFLAITGFQNEPESSGGRIFELTDDGPGLLKPTGPGGELPLSGFTGEGDKSGSYTIKLTGVESAPFSLGASPTGLPSGTGISFENDLIAIVEGVSPLDLSLGSANFVFA